ncbi:MAG: hypothetical protein A3D67_04430 [Candidatus Lloydbacteria bacterium RIFCSPHIGHO2_02_FULL_51_22]|uniref:Uncharacterized protein n=3 Tax=Candidatus Lloydiibacteriota TaxID=1817910 RepID=A0A1G2DI29_9BACT|nr:MAG: hypothetical protein A3D67_04430 [Candidatus Lloydbacteria bacterium RIFCSPHIGHO2_02_FULL_51_22]OGZ14231.1 MAG: hypothetical protein A3J08_03580 [Candidatus Lloydbacteria bacterium RIFCSPLOWO2_02_FULL_51_11]OGZ16785.1 MAG: hypothetical protein A3G11_02865 [Candidatus Lloydbacteria bacterium RIFCSPLOWO2_12_FULL_51_9]
MKGIHEWRRIGKRITTNSLQFVLFIFVAISVFPAVGEAGFGVSPPSIKETRLVPGSRVTRTIYLIQGNPEKEVAMDVAVESKDIKDWLSFEPAGSFTIPAGVQQFPLKVTVVVPEDAELGIYKAFIRPSTNPENAKSGVAISLGGRIDVELTVGNDVFESFTITNINIEHIRAGEKPKVEIEVENTGNVPTGPSAASFELFNKFGDIRLAYGDVEIKEEIASFAKRGLTIEFPLSVRLAEGGYWGNVKIYDDTGRSIKELRKPFTVKEGIGFTGFMAGVGFTGMMKTGLWALGGFFVLFIFFLLFRKRRRRK